ncbi:clostripain family protease [Burkholderiales bacterium JOSHI_001]|nr:clostripain family protease [Burkholderiales bacterium JOSHI_001]
MAKLPVLLSTPSRNEPETTDSVVLAVYAPFGSDAELSKYPNASQRPIAQQEIVNSLRQVAAQGVHVCALVDLVNDHSWWVQIPAKQPAKASIVSVWKQDMSHPMALAGFLAHVQRCHPCADIVLALEGHGAGYLPDIDGAKLTLDNITRNGNFIWHKSKDNTSVTPKQSPPLGMVSPELGMVSPELPATRMPMSTLGLARALRTAIQEGARKPAVIHFNNCFNLSVELLHTIAPYADFATAYANYNFFTAGAAYAKVFGNLRAQGSATRAELARWFAETNRDALEAKGRHPTMGGAIRLAEMRKLAALIDALAGELVAAMATAAPADRPGVVATIQSAIVQAQQYDTQADYILEVPDQLTDIRAFAAALTTRSFKTLVATAAANLEKALSGVRVYGSADNPHPRPSEFWDFKKPPLAMNILLPDPARQGLWDWRSPYYLRARFDPSLPDAQTGQIDFLKTNRWVDFIHDYHLNIDFVGLLPALPPVYPLFLRKLDPNGGATTGTTTPGNPTGGPGTTGRPGTTVKR